MIELFVRPTHVENVEMYELSLLEREASQNAGRFDACVMVHAESCCPPCRHCCTRIACIGEYVSPVLLCVCGCLCVSTRPPRYLYASARSRKIKTRYALVNNCTCGCMCTSRAADRRVSTARAGPACCACPWGNRAREMTSWSCSAWISTSSSG